MDSENNRSLHLTTDNEQLAQERPTRTWQMHKSNSDPSNPHFHMRFIEPEQATSNSLSEQGKEARKYYCSRLYERKLGLGGDNQTKPASSNAQDNSLNRRLEPQINIQRSISDGYESRKHLPTSYTSCFNSERGRSCIADSGPSFMLPSDCESLNKIPSQHTTLSILPHESKLIAMEHSLFKNELMKILDDTDHSLKTIDSNCYFQLILAHYKETAPGKKSYPTKPSASTKKDLLQEPQSSCSNWSSVSEYEPEIIAKLETSARCYDSTCPECLEIKERLKVLEDMDSVILRDSQEERILIAMFAHCVKCAIRCSFYWCEEFHKPLTSREDVLVAMKRRIEHYSLDPFLGDAIFEKFIQLNMNFPEYPKEEVDWSVLIMFKSSRRSILAMPKKQKQPHNMEYWVIKKIPFITDDDFQEMLYRRLGEIKPPGIVQHLWAATFKRPEIFVVCTSYQGQSIQEVVRDHPITSLTTTANLMLQLIQTTQLLHDHGILFLNWSGSNILINHTHTQVMLADFTASILKDKAEDNIGDVAANLPVHLLPPELLVQTKEVDESSDVWGLGCLLHEMVTGKPVWYNFCHKKLDYLHEKILRGNHPDMPVCRELSIVFKACLEIQRSNRPGLKELKRMIQNLLRSE